jgi:hypothetical protein
MLEWPEVSRSGREQVRGEPGWHENWKTVVWKPSGRLLEASAHDDVALLSCVLFNNLTHLTCSLNLLASYGFRGCRIEGVHIEHRSARGGVLDIEHTTLGPLRLVSEVYKL